jgi:ABC-type branched-subunit amino acid transport system ATPase component
LTTGRIAQLVQPHTQESEGTVIERTGDAPLLAIRDLHRDFEGLRAVEGASFTVNAGTITGLIGPNGAGKSTVLNLIAGSIRPTSGTITFAGHDVSREPAHRRAQRGIIRTFQISTGFALLTVLENLLVAVPRARGDSLLGALRGKRYWRDQEWAAVERARELLRRFDMEAKESEYVGDLSGGQKRLVEIMRSLMARPELLLLDEPMAGVHPNLAQRIAGYLETLRDEGLSMLLIEHELGIIERLCNPIIVMAQGGVLSEGTMSEVRSQPGVVNAYFVG